MGQLLHSPQCRGSKAYNRVGKAKRELSIRIGRDIYIVAASIGHTRTPTRRVMGNKSIAKGSMHGLNVKPRRPNRSEAPTSPVDPHAPRSAIGDINVRRPLL